MEFDRIYAEVDLGRIEENIGSDEAAVEADVARLAGGHDLDLSGDEILDGSRYYG